MKKTKLKKLTKSQKWLLLLAFMIIWASIGGLFVIGDMKEKNIKESLDTYCIEKGFEFYNTSEARCQGKYGLETSTKPYQQRFEFNIK